MDKRDLICEMGLMEAEILRLQNKIDRIKKVMEISKGEVQYDSDMYMIKKICYEEGERMEHNEVVWGDMCTLFGIFEDLDKTEKEKRIEVYKYLLEIFKGGK